MQRIKSHPSGANNRYTIPHCTRPQETKTGSLPRIIFEGVAKPTGCGVCLPEVGAAGPGPGMRRLLVRSEDVIDLGVSQIKLRIVVSIVSLPLDYSPRSHMETLVASLPTSCGRCGRSCTISPRPSHSRPAPLCYRQRVYKVLRSEYIQSALSQDAQLISI